MGTKELNILIWMFEQGDNETPRLWSLLDFKKFLLEEFEVLRVGCLRRWVVSLGDELGCDSDNWTGLSVCVD